MKVTGLLRHFYASNMLVDSKMFRQYCVDYVHRLDTYYLS